MKSEIRQHELVTNAQGKKVLLKAGSSRAGLGKQPRDYWSNSAELVLTNDPNDRDVPFSRLEIQSPYLNAALKDLRAWIREIRHPQQIHHTRTRTSIRFPLPKRTHQLSWALCQLQSAQFEENRARSIPFGLHFYHFALGDTTLQPLYGRHCYATGVGLCQPMDGFHSRTIGLCPQDLSHSPQTTRWQFPSPIYDPLPLP